MSPTPSSPAVNSITNTTATTTAITSTSKPNFPPITSSSSSSSSMSINYVWIPLLVALSKDFTAAVAGKVSSDGSNLLLPSQNHSVFDERRLGLSCPAVDSKLNYRPVIGILSHPGDGASGRLSNATNTSYIAASYVKFIESAGARVIPLIFNEPLEILLMKLNLVNGVLFTGGWSKMGLYFHTVQTVFKKALEKNDVGDHFPVFAICLGFELLTKIISKDKNILEEFNAADQASTLQFVENVNIQGTVFQRFPTDLLRKLSTDCLAMQNHHFGVSPEKFEASAELCSFFKVLTTSMDEDNKVYVSTVQAKNYPVTATQWHPEKNAFEWGSKKIPHSEDAIQVTQNVANYFVSEARKSLNRPDVGMVLNNLIYNYSPTYCGKAGKGFDEVYIFHRNEKLLEHRRR